MPHYELPPPSDETAAKLDAIRRTPTMTPADEKYVGFYWRTERSKEKSLAEGRPIFEQQEFIKILTVGDKDTVIDRRVRDLDRYIYEKKYVAFRNGKEQALEGTPLERWELLTPDRAAEYGHFRIKTVEQLAEVPDSALVNLGIGARKEREKAKQYLAIARGEAPVAELKAENEQLKARLEALEKLAAQGQAETKQTHNQSQKR